MSDAPVDRVEEQLRDLARSCAAMGSRFSGTLLEAAAQDYHENGPIRAFFDADPPRRDVARIGLRLMGALQRRALDGSAPELAAHYPSCGGDGDAAAAWREAKTLFVENAAGLGDLYARTPQTNEAARATPLLAGLLAIVDLMPFPVALLDLGTSAGLNLRLDRFRYEGTGWSWGDSNSPVALRNTTLAGRPAHLEVIPRIVERAGCDLHPLDVTRESDCIDLRSFVWADQPERFQRLDAAIAVAREVPAQLETADFLEWIPRRVVPTDGLLTVVMHSVVTEHLSPEVQERMRRAIDDACSAATLSAPMAWLRMEPVEKLRYETRITLRPSGIDRLIARCDGHAQSIEWMGT